MVKINLRYWICQVLGWGSWSLLNIFFVMAFVKDMYFEPPEKKEVFFWTMTIEFLWYIIATHLLRLVLKEIQWMRLPSVKIIMVFIAGVALTVILNYYGAKATAIVT